MIRRITINSGKLIFKGGTIKLRVLLIKMVLLKANLMVNINYDPAFF